MSLAGARVVTLIATVLLIILASYFGRSSAEYSDPDPAVFQFGALFVGIAFLVLCLPWNRFGRAVENAQQDFSDLSEAAGRALDRRRERNGPTIMGRDGFTQYSVADEISKWNKLREDGLVTEDEFNAARDKLLNRSK